MKLLYATAAVLALTSPSFAFDPTITEFVDAMKPKTVVDTRDLADLMKFSAGWCYDEVDGTCSWREVYLDVSDAGPRVETASQYWDDYNLYVVDKAEFQQDRYSCEYGYDWTPSVRLTRRSDGTPVNDKELDTFRVQFANNFGIDGPSCFDYQFIRADADAGTITLLQRTYREFVRDEDKDVVVTLHFNAADSNALTLR